MMRALIVPVICALVLAGCLGGDEATTAAPAPAPTIDDGVAPEQARKPASTVVEPLPTRAALAARPGPGLAAQLDGGAVALVDLTGRMEIRPRTIEFAKDGRLEGIEWQRWDARGAEGTGRMVGVACEPDCARGVQVTAPAVIRLSRPVACPRGRFFDRGRIEVASGDARDRSTSWLAAPC